MKKLSILIWTLLLTILIVPQSSPVACATCSEIPWGYSDGEFDQYQVSNTLTTPEGIAYDPSGLPISPQLIDRLTNEVDLCLTQLSPTGVLPSGIAQASSCFGSFQLPIQSKSFVVKVASDWVLSCDGTQQLLPKPVEAGPAGCVAKGQDPTAACPCRWRAGIECPNIIITTPSFYLYKDALTRFVTGCRNPWASPQLAQCASPSTTPLSDGTDPNNGLQRYIILGANMIIVELLLFSAVAGTFLGLGMRLFDEWMEKRKK